MTNLKNSSSKLSDTKQESTIQKEILLEFGARQDMRIWRQNTGALKIDDRFIRFGVPGQADITGLLIPSGRRLEIEVKKLKGAQRESQKNFEKMIIKSGGVYITARSVEEVYTKLHTYLWDK
ncbi:MAG: hypothetical protein IJW72_00265 [Alphaproteobacteria bacterium]|nr:hypothetical protein [Alphaproteobacteria bacterium]